MKQFFVSVRAAIFLAVVGYGLTACSTAPLPLTLYRGSEIGNAPRRALTPFKRQIIDGHKQLYDVSCIPSSVEMVLKLMGQVPSSYFELQGAWRNKTDGNFQDFEGRTIAGVTFHQRFSLPRTRRFPLTQLFDAIHTELTAGRYVIVGLASGDGWHNWVIYDEGLDGEFIAVSKAGAETIELRDVKKLITNMRGTDIGVCEPASHP